MSAFKLKILLLNQTFYPDVMATGQYLTELAVALVERGHQVTVVTSRRAYDTPGKKFPAFEIWRGIRIIRIGSTGFGKGAKWKRAADFGSFSFLCALKLASLPRFDCVVALTSPPLISFLGAWLAKWRGSTFYYWVMDFNPDEAIAAGWLRENSVAAKILDHMSRFSLRRAKKIIALDRFMRDRIVAKGIAAGKISVLPPWSHDGDVRFDPEAREKFRKAHDLDGRFVVMHSGNHSPCHPLDTLLQAAEKFSGDDSVAFCFIGGGSDFKKVKAWAAQHEQPEGSCTTRYDSRSPIHTSQFTNRAPKILCLPYQPLDQLSGSLSAADLHVVIMGSQFAGLVHPCKIYNILSVAAPVLYIGPRPSHVTDISDAANGGLKFYSAAHGEIERLAGQILQARNDFKASPVRASSSLHAKFSKHSVLPRLIAELESA
jgi:colanic acid biosynthesis glycosyl transferase WcaI